MNVCGFLVSSSQLFKIVKSDTQNKNSISLNILSDAKKKVEHARIIYK